MHTCDHSLYLCVGRVTARTTQTKATKSCKHGHHGANCQYVEDEQLLEQQAEHWYDHTNDGVKDQAVDDVQGDALSAAIQAKRGGKKSRKDSACPEGTFLDEESCIPCDEWEPEEACHDCKPPKSCREQAHASNPGQAAATMHRSG